jgi:hypothetical protein
MRRHRVSSATLAAVAADVWRLIGASAYRCPHVVFRLLGVCRGIRAALQSVDPGWWRALFRRVCAYQGGLRHSNTLRRLWAYQDPERGLRAVFAPQCEGCGARRGHRRMRPYALRACGRCLREGLVSNLALELRYGLSFGDFLAPYLAKGGFFLPLRAFEAGAPQQEALRRIAPEYDPRLANALCFFWRPDLARLCFLRLDEASAGRRMRAALTLAAHVRRRLRTVPPPLPVAWFPGGPYQRHTGRARYSPEGVARFEACLAEATARLRPYLRSSWLPDVVDASI